MKVLVTGANGLLATNVIIELLARGYTVRGFLRNKRNFKYREKAGLELFEGDITNEADIEAGLTGCHAVIHAAAMTDQGLGNSKAYHPVNVEATKSLLDVSIRHDIKRFVYVGTANAFGYGSGAEPGYENKPVFGPFVKSGYVISKLKAQEIVLSSKGNMEVVVVNPTFMLGSFDSKPGSGRIILMGYNKKFIFYPPGGKNFVHASDVAKGIVAALKTGRDRESYLLAGENLSYREFFKTLVSVADKKTILIRIPLFVLMMAGVIGDLLQKTGKKSEFSSTNMKILSISNFYSNEKSKNELGITYRPVANAIRDAVKWFKEEGMLPRDKK